MRKAQVGMGRGKREAWCTDDHGWMLPGQRINIEELGNERDLCACYDIPKKINKKCLKIQ